MAVIKVNNVTVQGNGRVLTDITAARPDAIEVDGLIVKDNAVALQNVKISEFVNAVEYQTSQMTSEEYASFKKLLLEKDKNKDTFHKLLSQHLRDFATGVAANLVSGFLLK